MSSVLSTQARGPWPDCAQRPRNSRAVHQAAKAAALANVVSCSSPRCHVASGSSASSEPESSDSSSSEKKRRKKKDKKKKGLVSSPSEPSQIMCLRHVQGRRKGVAREGESRKAPGRVGSGRHSWQGWATLQPEKSDTPGWVCLQAAARSRKRRGVFEGLFEEFLRGWWGWYPNAHYEDVHLSVATAF